MQTTPPDSYDDPLPYGEHISFTEYAEASHNSFKRGDTLPDVPVPEMMAQAATSPEKPASRPRSPFIAAIVVALAFAVIVGSALTYYTTVSYPTELNAHATAVVRNVLKIQTQTALAATATTNALSPEELYSSITRRAPDILDSLNTSATSSWYNGQAPSGSGLCFFSGNSFHIKVERTLFSMTCYSQLGNDRNFVYQVQMTILRGGTGGLYFRGNPASYILGYVFLVDQEGNYALFIYHDRNQRILLATGFAASMARGLGQTNLISVMARGKILDLYVNRQLVISVADSTYNNGEFGLIGGQRPFQEVPAKSHLTTPRYGCCKEISAMFCSRCGTSLCPAFRSCPVCGTPILTGGIAPSLLDKEGSENSGFENIPYVEFGPIGESVSPLVRADASIQAQPVALAPATEVSRPETRAQPVPSSVALQKRPQPHGGSTTWVIAISTFLILLIITAGGLMYYAIAAHPAGLSAQATAVAQTVLTAQVNATSPQYVYTYATRGKPVINDPLSDEGTSEWYREAPPQANCVFQNGTYHIFTAHQYTRTLCSAGMSFTNFAFQIQMTIFEGKYGGVAFRMVGRDYQWYNLAVGQDGYYMLNLFNGTSGMKALAFRFDSSIKRGLGQTNLITIVGLGNTFFLYINRQFLTQFSDDTYESGQFGLEATSHEYPTADVAYSNLQIWKL